MYQYIPFPQNQHKLMELMGVTKVLMVFLFTCCLYLTNIFELFSVYDVRCCGGNVCKQTTVIVCLTFWGLNKGSTQNQLNVIFNSINETN